MKRTLLSLHFALAVSALLMGFILADAARAQTRAQGAPGMEREVVTIARAAR